MYIFYIEEIQFLKNVIFLKAIALSSA